MSHISEQTDNHKAENLIPTNQWGCIAAVDKQKIEENLFDVKKKIAPYNVKIVAVTKYFGLDGILNGYQAGLKDFGESRAQDAIKKIESLPEEVRKNSNFHFIGHVQTNKVEKIVKNFDYIHSVDSLKLAQNISNIACSLNKRENVLLQVNNAGEAQKFGYSKSQLKQEFGEILKLEHIKVVGLMNMAPLGANKAELGTLFKDLRDFKQSLERDFGTYLPELSMGMSDDYEIAVKEGATIIRLGRKLFN